MRNYIGLIHKDTDSDYGVSFPDFPGVVTAGIDLDEARTLAAEALAFHIEGMVDDGEAIPEPSTLETIMADPDNKQGVAVLIPVKTDAAKTVRVNITIQSDTLQRIDSYAESNGLTRSGFLTKAAMREIERSERQTLQSSDLESALEGLFDPPLVDVA